MPVLSTDTTTAAPQGIASLRPTIAAHDHMAVAGHYGAAHAAFRVLEAGGNAVDAGVAGGIALGVLQSDIVNVAGVAPILIYLAERDEVVSIAGLGTWPAAADVERFRREFGGHVPSGILRTVVPAAPAAWIAALERFGTMSFGEVAAAAIRFARDGFALHQLMAEIIAEHEADYRKQPEKAAIYLPGGRPPRAGDKFVQADLARTLQFMADEERKAAGRGRAAGLQAARDAFYKGDIARAIVKHHRANGGWMEAADLAGFAAEIEPAVRVRYKQYDVFTCPAWCQGPAMAQAFKLVDGIDLRGLGHNSPAYLHVVAEALKLAFADRERYFGDPRFVDVPVARLLSDDYIRARRALIRPDRAFPGLPPAGELGGRGGAEPRPSAAASRPALDTSYVCVVDKEGNAFSATPSDSSYDGEVIPGTGLVPSTRGSQNWCEPSHPSVVAPGKRPRLTPSPALALGRRGRKGREVLPFGTPGGDVQIQAMLQTFLNRVEFAMEPQRAVEQPRIATYSFPDSFEPHGYQPGRLNLEARLPRATGEALAALGHDVQWWPQWIWRAGATCLIHSDPDTGLLSAGADPRRACYALGW
ncbi:MAG: gamma-glutamyltransferase [Alphaproteobacteria bacterium]|nr:gamma-glutamyltransferase [Alphaproteobacteria bacterium]